MHNEWDVEKTIRSPFFGNSVVTGGPMKSKCLNKLSWLREPIKVVMYQLAKLWRLKFLYDFLDK